MIATILTIAKLGNGIFLKDFWYLVLKSAIFQPTFPTIRIDSFKTSMKYDWLTTNQIYPKLLQSCAFHHFCNTTQCE